MLFDADILVGSRPEAGNPAQDTHGAAETKAAWRYLGARQPLVLTEACRGEAKGEELDGGNSF